MRKSTTRIASLALFGALTVTGGCVASSSTPGESLTPDNAWGDAIPPEAQRISVDEFERQLAANAIKLVYPASIQADRKALDTSFHDNRARLKSMTGKPDYMQQLLDETEPMTTYPSDTSATLPSGDRITLLGPGAQIADGVVALAKAQSVQNALDDYRLTHDLLPDELKASVPSPDDLASTSAEEVRAALAAIDQVLTTPAAASVMNRARPEPSPPSVLFGKAVVVPTPGNGSGGDTNGVCYPSNYAGSYWFPLKNFVSPIKQQANRGVCWAFAAIGALETRERVQNNNPADLSEQFLINKVRRDWAPSDTHEAGDPDYAVNEAVAKSQPLPLEAAWVYNPSWSRTITETTTNVATITTIRNSCLNYNGTCSDSVHQSALVCTDAAMTHCGYQSMLATGPTVSSSNSVQLWVSGQTFDINRYQFLLNQGHVLIASFPVYDGFANLTPTDRGVVSDYEMVHTVNGKKLTGSYGDHVVQIVGFLPDAGNLFIVKNSWGCGAGDAGYYYVPAEYVRTRFHHLSVLSFTDRRSDAWRAEQTKPSAAPNISLRALSPSVDLRVEKNLAEFFTISHPVAKSVFLRVTSDRDGVLYDGGWNSGPALFNVLATTFGSEGVRTITLSTRLSPSSAEATASFTVNVVNSAPTILWQQGSAPVRDEIFALTALTHDRNENDPAVLCNSATWSVDAPDTLSNASGCAQRITFKQAGKRQVRITVRDREGVSTSATLELDVQEPSSNPYPRIVGYGVYSRQTTGNGLRFCGNVGQADGATIDLREKGCSFRIQDPSPQRYFGRVTIENPNNEALIYEWKYFVRSSDSFVELAHSSQPYFDLYSLGNTAEVTNDCYVSVTVHAPDPSRSKSLTVWSGRCTYDAIRLR